MKKFLISLLCAAMFFSMIACGGESNTTDNSNNTSGVADTTPSDNGNDAAVPDNKTDDVNDNSDSNVDIDDTVNNDNTETPTPEIDDTTIRENGQLPEDEDELTPAEFKHYTSLVVQAIIDLDVETMEEYACEDDAYLIEITKENDVYRSVWERTIGQSIYLEDSSMLIYKDPNYVLSKWVMDMADKGGEFKDETGDYTLDELVAFFDAYSADTPWIATQLDLYDDIDIDMKDGRIVMECNDVLSVTPWDELSDVSAPSYNYAGSNKKMANLIFGEAPSIRLGTDYISDDGKFTIWEPTLTGDLSKITAAFDSATGYDLNAEIGNSANMLWEKTYQYFYKDAERREKIQNFMDENVVIVRDFSTVYVYIPAETEHTYPYDTLTDAEKEEIKDLDISIVSYIFRQRANTQSEFDPFYEIAAQMARLGLIEWMDGGMPV